MEIWWEALDQPVGLRLRLGHLVTDSAENHHVLNPVQQSSLKLFVT